MRKSSGSGKLIFMIHKSVAPATGTFQAHGQTASKLGLPGMQLSDSAQRLCILHAVQKEMQDYWQDSCKSLQS